MALNRALHHTITGSIGKVVTILINWAKKDQYLLVRLNMLMPFITRFSLATRDITLSIKFLVERVTHH